MRAFPWRRGMTFQPPTKSFPGFDEGLIVQEVVTIRDGSTWLRWREGGEEDPADSESRRSYMEQANGWRLADEVEPDAADGATKGALLEVVREAFRRPRLVIIPGLSAKPDQDTWYIQDNPPDAASGYEPTLRRDGTFSSMSASSEVHATSEFAALLAAWEAAP